MGNCIPKVALLLIETSVFPSAVAVIPQLLREHVIESLGFLLDVTAKDFHAVLVSIGPPQIFNLCVHKHCISTESGGNVAVDFSDIGSFRIEFGLIL